MRPSCASPLCTLTAESEQNAAPGARGRASHLEGRGVLAWLAVLVIAINPHHHQHRWPHYPAWWLKQAACIRYHESRDQWHIDTGNGYYGAYQFLWSTWRSVGGTQRPDLASPRMQTYRAWLVWRRDGGTWREWGTAGYCA